MRTYRLTSTQSWLDARIHVPELFRSSPVVNGFSFHSGFKLPSRLSQSPTGPPRFQSRHSDNRPRSTNPDTSNGCQDEDVTFDIGNGNQDDDARFDIGTGNQSMDVGFDIGNGKHNDDASIDIGNGNQGRDASFNVHDRIQNSSVAMDEVDAEVLELARAFRSLGTEEIFELVCTYTALCPIYVNCFLDPGCIPKYVPSAERVQCDTPGCK